jgi:hypothetical protein
MSQYFDKSELFLEPKVKQYGSHMVMSNVHKPTKTKYVNIDTKFSDDYNSTCSVANYNITLPERINDVKSISVTNLELPMSFYNISRALGNNSFKMTNLSVDTTLPYLIDLSSGYINENNQFVDIITIPDGYYTIDRLKTVINSQIDKVKRIPTNANNYVIFDANGNIVYDLVDNSVLLLTDLNYDFNPDGSFIYIKDANGDNIPDAYGNLKIQLKSGEYLYISNELKNTSDLRFDYYVKTSEGVQGYFYSNQSNIEIDFTVNSSGQFEKYNFKSKLGWLLGFRNLTYTISFLYTPPEGDYDPTDRLGPDGQALTYGEFLVDLNTIRYVYLALEEFNKSSQNSFVSPTASSLVNKNIIARISLDRSNYSFGSYLPANIQNGLLLSDTRVYSGKIDMNRLNLQIVNEVGIPLPLNGSDFSLCLQVEHD